MITNNSKRITISYQLGNKGASNESQAKINFVGKDKNLNKQNAKPSTQRNNS